MFIAIDSAKQMLYTGVVSGWRSESDRVYQELKQVLNDRGIREPFHWAKLSRKVKSGIENDVISTVNSSMLNFTASAARTLRTLVRR